MSAETTAKFGFTIQGFPDDTFHVVRFSGSEGISRIYLFDIALLTDNGSVDMEQAMAGDAALSVFSKSGKTTAWHGVLRDLQLIQRVDGRILYRAVLAPRAYSLCLNHQSRIFLDKQTPQIIRECLIDSGLLPGHDFDMRDLVPYPKREYTCQYNETDFAFLSRVMERSGLYFYFDQAGPRESLLVADHMNTLQPAPEGDTLTFHEPSGMNPVEPGKCCAKFSLERRRLPSQVQLRDHNYRIPGFTLESTAEIAPQGQGALSLHDGNIRSTKEAKYLASVRAEAYKSRESVFFGESDAAFIRPGWTFTLRDHFKADWNRAYLPTEVKHEGSQEGWLSSGLGVKGLGDKLFYRNSFSAIPALVQYRSEAKTPRPTIPGVLHAHIDAEGSGEYAELDQQGRYKVIMPFDLSGRENGKASSWVRMIQPYAGSGHGMHFPLHKGTEVALVFEEGDPDRPVIAGAVSNPAARSVVTSDNQTQSRIHTAGGNSISMEDQEGSQRIMMQSPTSSTFFRLGAHNDPVDWSNWDTSDGAALASGGTFMVQVQAYNQLVFGDYSQTTVGFQSYNCLGLNFTANIGGDITLNIGGSTEFTPKSKKMRAEVRKAEAEREELIGKVTMLMEEHTKVMANSTTVANESNEVIDEKRNSLAYLNQTIADQQRTVLNLSQTVADKNETLANLNQTIADRKTTVANLEQTIGQKNEIIANLDKTIGNETKMVDSSTQMATESIQIGGGNTMINDITQMI